MSSVITVIILFLTVTASAHTVVKETSVNVHCLMQQQAANIFCLIHNKDEKYLIQ